MPWLICLTTRTTERGLRAELGYEAERIHLEPLGVEAALELATDASANDPLPDHLLAEHRGRGRTATRCSCSSSSTRSNAARRSTSCRRRSRPCSRHASTRSRRRTGGCSATSRCSALGSTRRWSRTCSATSLPDVGAPRVAAARPLPRADAGRLPLPQRARPPGRVRSAALHAPARVARARGGSARTDGRRPEVADLLSMHYEAARRFGPAWTVLAARRRSGPRPLRERRSRDLLPARAASRPRRRRSPTRTSPPSPSRSGDVSELLGRYGEALAAYKVARRRLGDGDRRDAAPAPQDRHGAGARRALPLRARLAPPQPRGGGGHSPARRTSRRR